MNKKREGIAAGLDALLSDFCSEQTNNDPLFDREAHCILLPLEQIILGQFQPRKTFDEKILAQLAESIKDHGILQPLIARQINAKQYELIAGERRFRAAKLAGLQKVPVLIKTLTENQAIAIGLIENIQRENLNAIEEAQGIARLIEEHQMTHEQVAKVLGRSRPMITNLLRLLQLHPLVQEKIEMKLLEMGHGRALLTLTLTAQVTAMEYIIAKDLSVRQTENWVQQINQKTTPKRQVLPEKYQQQSQAYLKRLTQKLSKVNIQVNSKGQGRVVIHFNDLDQVERLVQCFEEKDEQLL